MIRPTTTEDTMTTTPTRETRRPTPESAIAQTLQLVSVEQNPDSGLNLSADVVAFTDDGKAIVSVINMETREHWWITVHTTRPTA